MSYLAGFQFGKMFYIQKILVIKIGLMVADLIKFVESAQKLSRNPLGIIALFIVLVYGIAALVLGVSSQNLDTIEKMPIILFLIIFPFVVLGCFYRLVTHHHIKLYAPRDFFDKEGFFRGLSPNEQKKRIDEEIKAFQDNEERNNKQMSSKELDNVIKSKSFRSSYLLAEELAIREIEHEFKASIQRQVAFAKDIGADGFFMKNGVPIIIEIKLTKFISEKFMNHTLERLNRISIQSEPEPHFLLALVFIGLSIKEIKSIEKKIINILNKSKLSIEYRLYDLNYLKNKYGIS